MKKYIPFKYSNLEEFLIDITILPPHQLDKDRNDSSWSGAENDQHAMEIARTGYDLQKIDIKINQMEVSGVPQMDIVWDVSGSVVDVGAFLSGEPENMIDFPIVDNKQFIQIFVDTCENSGVSGDNILNKAAAVAYAVDKLESSNFRVELHIVYPYDKVCEERMYENHIICLKIKGFQEKISVGQIAGCVAPSFQRHLMFRHQDKYAFPPPLGRGKIQGVDVHSALRTVADSGQEFVFLPGYLRSKETFNYKPDFSTAEGAVKWAEHFINNKLKY